MPNKVPFSKQPVQTKTQEKRRKHKDHLPYEVVHRIATYLLVDELTIFETAKKLKLNVEVVRRVREARSHKDFWIEAIADLGRKGLISG